MKTHEYTARGFTVVEIMIVVGIIGLLASIAIPAFNRVRETSQGKTCVNNLRQIAYAKDQYFLENGGQLTVSLTALTGPTEYIKAMPLCPAGGMYTPDPLELDSEPVCSIGGEHALPSGL